MSPAKMDENAAARIQKARGQKVIYYYLHHPS